MSEKLIIKLKGEGKLVRQKTGFSQVEALLREAIPDMKEAAKVITIADRATYILAYMAMLKAGRALLLMKGYRPADGAQHKTVVDVTGIFLGKRYSGLVMHFETMRRKRNEMTYEAGGLLSSSEAKAAFEDAAALLKQILKKVKAQNPQLSLRFGK
jgi:uncharacterized protein (UPF0332 family)